MHAQCAVVSASDGRWRVASCGSAFPTACRLAGAPINAAEVVVGRSDLDRDSTEQARR